MKNSILFFILLVSHMSYAQLSVNKINTHISYTSKDEYFKPLHFTFISYSFVGKITIEYNKYCESGIFVGKTMYNKNEQFSTFDSKYVTSYTYFGINHSFFIFPICKIKSNRFQVYVPLNLGVSYMKFPNNIITASKSFLYSYGIGTSLNIIKRMSIFFECEFNNRVSISSPYLQFGVSYNWGKIKDE